MSKGECAITAPLKLYEKGGFDSAGGHLDLFLAEALGQVVSSARKDIGIEPLMQETQKAIAEEFS